MAYLDIDLAGPIAGAFVTNTRVRNRILNSPSKWPTTTVDGTEVFDKLYLYRAYAGGLQYNENIFKVLGMKPSDITRTENLDKVQDIWLYLKPVEVLEYNEDGTLKVVDPIDGADVAEYINNNSSLGEEVEIEVLYTQVTASQNIRAYNFGTPDTVELITKEQIVEMVEGGYASTYPVPIVENVTKYVNGQQTTVAHESYNKFINFDTKTSAVAFASLMDTNDDLFESSTEVIAYTAVPAFSTNYDGDPVPNLLTVSCTLLYKFKRIKDASEATELVDYIAGKANIETRHGMAMYDQLSTMKRSIRPLSDGSLFKTVVTEASPDGETPSTSTQYVIVGTDTTPFKSVDNPDYDPNLPTTEDLFIGQELMEGDNPARFITQYRVAGTGMRGLKKKSFAPLFGRMVDSDYTMKPVKKKWYSGLLTILVIVVAVVIAVASAGALSGVSASAVAAGTAGTAAIATFMTALAFTLTLAVVAVGSLARATAGRSQSFAMAVGRAMITLSVIAEAVGIIATVLTVINWAQAARTAIGNQIQGEAGKQAATQVAQDAGLELMEEASEEAIKKAVTDSAVKAFQDASMQEIISAVGAVAYESVKASVVNASSTIVSALNGSLFTNMSTTEILTSAVKTINMATELFNKASPKADPSIPEPAPGEVPYIPDKIETLDLVQSNFDDGSMYEPKGTAQMCDDMTGATIRRPFDRCYANEFP